VAGTGIKSRIRALNDRAQRTSAFRAYDRYRTRRGSRLAAAITYSAFLSIFPLLAVATAITAATLGDAGIRRLQDQLQENVPGLADELSLTDVVSNAATIGVISGVLLVWSGLSWVNTARGSMRTVWAVDDMPGTYVQRKAMDLVSLVGLGATIVVVAAASTLTSGFAATVLRWLHVENTDAARLLLQALGVVLSLVLQTAMFAYLLAGIPRLSIPRRVLLGTAFVAAVVFEVTKGLVTTYLTDVAGKSVYGAFGLPIAILVWFNLTFQMLLALAAWTATRTEDELARRGQHGAGFQPMRPP
jgi:membrane protein